MYVNVESARSNKFDTFSERLTCPPTQLWVCTGPYNFQEGIFGQIFSRIVQPISFWKAAKFDRWTISVGPASARNDRLIIILDMAIIFWSKLFFLVILQLVLKMTVTRQILPFPATMTGDFQSDCLTGNLARNNCLITQGSQLSARFEFPDFPWHFSGIFPDLPTQIWRISLEIPSVARIFFLPTVLQPLDVSKNMPRRHKILFTPQPDHFPWLSLTLHKKY